MASTDPKVAVLIAAKDARRTVARAVRSALAQPEAAEVVLVDDGSTDGTAEVAARCADPTGRLRILRRPNRGPAAARNAALAASHAPWVCVLDADDAFMPGRLAAVFQALGTDWDLAADKLLLGREGAEDGPYQRWRADEPLPARIDFVQFVEGNISRYARPRAELGYLKPLMRRAFLDAHGLRFREDIWLGEDYLLYAEALGRGARFLTAEIYGYVSIARAGSLSHDHPPERLAALLDADVALEALDLTFLERRALRRHEASVRQKWLYRLALDAKREGRLGQAAALVMRSPDVFTYVLGQTLQAKVRGLARSASPPAAVGPR